MTDFDKASGQDMDQKTANELIGAHGSSGVAPCRDGDVVVGDREDSVVREADTVCITTEVGEHLLGTGEGSLGVDDPVFCEEGSAEDFELFR